MSPSAHRSGVDGVVAALKVYVASLPILRPSLAQIGGKTVVLADVAFMILVLAVALSAKTRMRPLRRARSPPLQRCLSSVSWRRVWRRATWRPQRRTCFAPLTRRLYCFS